LGSLSNGVKVALSIQAVWTCRNVIGKVSPTNMSPEEYSAIKIELLKILFNNRSTLEISRLMGYSFDQARRWLNGHKELRWDEFCDLCEVLHFPLRDSLIEIFNVFLSDSDDNYFFIGQLRRKMPGESMRTLHKKLRVHPSILKRYFKGEVFPNLEFVFEMINLNSNILGSFLVRLVGPQRITPIHELFEKSQGQIQVAMFYPMAPAIEGLLCTEEYKNLQQHDENWFCNKLGITLNEFQQTWNSMVRNQRVELLAGKYQITYQTINTTGSMTDQINRMADFWTERARLRFMTKDHKPIRNSQIPGVFAYRILPMSKDAAMKAIHIISDAFSNVLALAESDPGPYQDVRVLVVHNFSVEDHPNESLDQTKQEPLKSP
jgi:hypothetical protein